MPTYDYYCKTCDEITEVYHTINFDSVIFCKKCGNKMKRKISGTSNVIFKGAGFYCNDYKKEINDSEK